MADERERACDLLDEMAVKIMVVEPGDLSFMGELLELLEKLSVSDEIASMPPLLQMATSFQQALQKVIMGELADSTECYARLGECISRMQEVARGSKGHSVVNAFCTHLTSIGFKTDQGSLFGVEAAGSDILDNDAPFLKDRELLECFLDETVDYLTTIETTLLSLEKEPDNQEAIHSVFRAFHTIKGTAGSVSLDGVRELAHATESLLHEVRSGAMVMDGDVIEVVLGVADALRAMVAHVRDVSENGVPYIVPDIDDQLGRVNEWMERKRDGVPGQTGVHVAGVTGKDEQAAVRTPLDSGSRIMDARENVDVVQPDEEAGNGETSLPGQGAVPDFLKDSDLLSGFITEAFEHLESIELHVLDLEQNPEDAEIINNIFRPFHTIKGVSGFLNLTTINKLAHATENLLDDVRNERLFMNSDIIDIVLGVGDFLRTMIQNISDVLEKGSSVYHRYDITDFLERIKVCRSGGESPAPQVEVREEKTNSAPVAFKPSLVPEEGAATPQPLPPASTPELPKAETVYAAGPKKNVEASIKVDINKLDGLVNAVGELVIMQAMVRHNPFIERLSDPQLNKDFAQLNRITTELQKTAMSMRMVPIRQTFQKMTRLVRDLSKKTGKKVNLVMAGEETEIDRNMVDSIYDPLVHMIRNSVDHGVQVPEERIRSGKPESGTVRLGAYQKGGNIVIEIADDGEGVRTGKIREKAIERGLIRKDDDLSDHEINNLIFLPGFSTADKITDVSGRGVGMDVVKKGVEKLRGKVDLRSKPGEGSLFLIFLPLTLAIIDGIVVRVGTERYIIPTIAIRESMRPQMEHYNTVQNKGETLLVRDTLIPVIRLYRLFGVAEACDEISKGIVVIIENEGRQRALLVDELLGKQEVVIKSLGGYMKDVRGVAGGTILGDGRVGLILDLAGLINLNNERGSGQSEGPTV
ncbi:MAG: chemotaxis protein CheA [Pseudomonadota bacterium]